VTKPPLIGRILLRLLVPRRLHEAVSGDLEEWWHAGTLTPGGYLRAVVRSVLDIIRLSASARGPAPEVSSILQDIRFGARMMRRHPGVSLAAIVTLAIGIGGSTAMFSAVHPTLFEPLPYPASHRLLSVGDRTLTGVYLDVTFGTYREILARSRAFDALAVVRPWQPVIAGDGTAERLEGQRVTASYFRVLGVQPTLGRDFTDEDDRPGAPRVVIVSDGLWRRRFASDPAVVGREISLGAFGYTIAGVMPRAFENVLAPEAEIWTPLQYDRALPADGREWGHHLRLIARMRDGMTIAAAAADLDAIARSPIGDFPRVAWASLGNGFIVSSLQDDLTSAVRPVLLAFAGAVLLVLTIACANVANLLLARAVHRQREFAMRAALGAGRWRLTRQLLVEGLLIAAFAGALGVLAARITLDAVVALAPAGLPRLDAIAVDVTALLFAVAVTSIVGLGVALLPAIQAFRGDLQPALRHNTRTAAGGHRRMRQVFVIAEVALALVLLVSAGLLFRSLRQLVAISPGFDAEQLVVAQIQTSGAKFLDAGVTQRFFDQVLEGVRALPGVSAAAVTSQLPLTEQADRFGVFIEDDPTLDPEADRSAFRYAVTAGYFEAMRVPLRRGRALTGHDRAGAPLAVVISETLARRRFPGIDPVGRRIRIGATDGPWFTVVGVAGDVKQGSLNATNTEAVYVTPEQWFFADPARWIVVRGTAHDALPSAIRAAVRAIDAGQPVVRMTSMSALLAGATSDRRFALGVFAAFGVVALVLAVTGLYSALARHVTERTREIGVRTALGASRRGIVLMVLRQGLIMTGAGIAIGAAAAVFATRLLEALLFGTTAIDPATYVSVIGLFVVVAVIASGLPAARAVSIDPAITLRAD
jgi:predicted permease